VGAVTVLLLAAVAPRGGNVCSDETADVRSTRTVGNTGHETGKAMKPEMRKQNFDREPDRDYTRELQYM
jgi:hypothetical protein